MEAAADAMVESLRSPGDERAGEWAGRTLAILLPRRARGASNDRQGGTVFIVILLNAGTPLGVGLYGSQRLAVGSVTLTSMHRLASAAKFPQKASASVAAGNAVTRIH
jgi:hypothetical protein